MGKLSFNQAQEIRARYTGAFGEKKQLAKEYGVSPTTIAKIVTRQNLTEPNKLRKLTRQQVDGIRASYTGQWGEMAALAKRYGVTRQMISFILKGSHGTIRRSVLTLAQAREIRAAYTEKHGSALDLARKYGVSRQVITRVVYHRAKQYED